MVVPLPVLEHRSDGTAEPPFVIAGLGEETHAPFPARVVQAEVRVMLVTPLTMALVEHQAHASTVEAAIRILRGQGAKTSGAVTLCGIGQIRKGNASLEDEQAQMVRGDLWYFTASMLNRDPQETPRPTDPTRDLLGHFRASRPLSGNRLVHVAADGTITFADAELGLDANGFILPAVAQGETVAVYSEGLLPTADDVVPGAQGWLGTEGRVVWEPMLDGRLIIQEVGTASESRLIHISLDQSEQIE
jgi:hypothetical protein